MKYIFLVLLSAFLLMSCKDTLPVSRTISFDDASASYRSSYGTPEDVDEYKSTNYHSINWWWWSRGFMVNFVDSAYDNVDGWKVDHTFSFDPI